MESASKEEQPVQEAIDYCKNPKNGIQLFINSNLRSFYEWADHISMTT
jgi:hypothetical protein